MKKIFPFNNRRVLTQELGKNNLMYAWGIKISPTKYVIISRRHRRFGSFSFGIEKSIMMAGIQKGGMTSLIIKNRLKKLRACFKTYFKAFSSF